MLSEQMKRWMAMGLGLALLTKEKAEAAVKELVEQGELSREEGRELLENLMERAQREKDEWKRRIDGELRRIAEAAGFAKEEDVRRLEEYIRQLEARVEKLEREASGGQGEDGGDETRPEASA